MICSKKFHVRRSTTSLVCHPDFVATTESKPLGSDPPHHCESFLPEHPQTFHPHAGVSYCKVGKKKVILLPQRPTKFLKINHAFINKQFIDYKKMKKLLTLTIFRVTPTSGISPEVWGNGKLHLASGVNRATEKLLDVRTKRGKFQ